MNPRSGLHTVTAPLAPFLAHVELGTQQFHKTLALWPLSLRDDAPPSSVPPYVALATALEADFLRVDEVGESGSVPHVRVVNEGDVAVLVLFGEELRGAKQNRVANASFLIAPNSSTVIDVSCVEHGRWSTRGGAATFSAAREVLSPSMRFSMARRVSTSRAAGIGFNAGQNEVWDDVAARLVHVGSRSTTSAYSDYSASRRAHVADVFEAVALQPRQVGFVAAIGGQIAGLELIGLPAVFSSAFAGLVRGYAIDAIDAELVRARAPQRGSGFEAPDAFLDALRLASAHAGASIGLGDDLRIDDGRIAGCALLAGELVHLTAFPAEAA